MGERRVKTKADSSVSFDEDQAFGLGDSFDLMRHRVGEILLVSSLYDSYTLEEDGQLGDRILADYVDLHLRYTPRVTRVSTARKALNLLGNRRFDLVITMMRLPDMDVVAFSEAVKSRFGTPVVMLAYDSPELRGILKNFDPSAVRHVVVWSGDSRILLATIKLIEDRWNVDHDTEQGMVRVILLVEDSVRRLSSCLPMIYTELMTQTRKVMAEGLNYVDKLLRMRTRPKILLARDYEDAQRLYDKYREHMLAVISDVRFPRGGEMDGEAGLDLLKWIRDQDPRLPVVMHSAEAVNREPSEALRSYFLDKNSPTWLQDLHEFFVTHLGFGDFIFRDADTKYEIDRARTTRQMERKIRAIPDESLVYHLSQHHLSTWMMARGEQAVAKRMRGRLLSEFPDLDHARQYVCDQLNALRAEKRRGVVSDFPTEEFDPTTPFVRIGGGSLGGKGRGIAFLAALMHRLRLNERYPDVRIHVPQTVAIGTDVFTEFLEVNTLEKAAVHSDDDMAIAAAFLGAELDRDVMRSLQAYLKVVKHPLAVRSSSLLEDSLYQPFAGMYCTYMLPNNHPRLGVRLQQLCAAIKLVYASTFFQGPKAYIRSSPFRVEEERMGVIVQRLAANRHGDVCYPNFAGVAQSYNYYPVGRLKANEGLVQTALGLGKMVVEGGNVLRFSPARPKVLPQFSSIGDMLRNSQTEFYALDLANPDVRFKAGLEGPLIKLGLDRAERDGTLAPVGSVYARADGAVRDGIYHEGPRLVTFAHVLKSGQFPLATILQDLLSIGRRATGNEVEIEFAVNLNPPEAALHEFAVLQCRPMARSGGNTVVDLEQPEADRTLCWTGQALGNGVIDDLYDVVYVPLSTWDPSHTVEIAREVGRINERLEAEDRRYILIGMGRWGTADHWLGIPVGWHEIAGARVMVEVGTADYQVEPSQGSHFFHNITAFRIGYLTVQEGRDGAFLDWNLLDRAPAISQTAHVRHVRFSEPLQVALDGRKGCGAILKPGESLVQETDSLDD